MLATRVQLLPEVMDLSYVPAGSGLVSYCFLVFGVLRGFGTDRVVKLSVFGSLIGGLSAIAGLALGAAYL